MKNFPMKNFIFIILILFVFSSCATRKQIVYFQGAEDLQNYESLLQFEPVIEVNDLLSIVVSSENPNVVAPFMGTSVASQGIGGMGGQPTMGARGGQQNTGNMGYLVDIDGNIQFPVLGQIHVAGKSRSELEKYFTTEIRSKHVTDAVVAIRLLNFRVVVLGETGQTVVQVENERISVPELIATVGGITYDGKRDNILIIREIEGVKTIGRVDMTSADIFKSPFYYLKQNDVVYVEPTYRQVKSAGFITSWQGLVSIATTAFSLFIIFTR